MDYTMIIFLIAMIAIFYFLIIRPQSKRMNSLSVGDEVVSVGGIMGEISKVDENYVFVMVADKVELRFQKAAISSTLPKGTLKELPESEASA